MIEAAALLVILAGSLADGIVWALAHRRAQCAREAWPPRRVVATADNIEETF
jgi:hypothetical protein